MNRRPILRGYGKRAASCKPILAFHIRTAGGSVMPGYIVTVQVTPPTQKTNRTPMGGETMAYILAATTVALIIAFRARSRRRDEDERMQQALAAVQHLNSCAELMSRRPG